MARPKGSLNRSVKPPVLTLSPEQRLTLIADLLIEIICEKASCDQI